MTGESELTEEEIMAVDEKVKAGIRKHYQRKLSRRAGKKPGSS
jgi:hypothetical protein